MLLMIPMMRMLSKPAQVVTIMMMRMPAEVDDDENAINASTGCHPII